jgi:hypothetical protein
VLITCVLAAVTALGYLLIQWFNEPWLVLTSTYGYILFQGRLAFTFYTVSFTLKVIVIS